jgi:hypothetical protein
MSSTNGSQATPSRDEIIRLSTYHAAIAGYFDTSEAAQKAGLLTISVMDMARNEALPPGATHKFYVMINHSGSMVTRFSDNRYQVEPHDKMEAQRQERELRTAVLDYALWHMTGEGAGYHPDQGPEARAAAIKELLEEGPEDQQQEREEADPVNHPVIRDEEPDPTISLAPGSEGGPAPQVLRQWSVQIGPYNSCTVAFFGYDAEDSTPVLIAMENEEEGGDYDEDEEEEEE